MTWGGGGEIHFVSEEKKFGGVRKEGKSDSPESEKASPKWPGKGKDCQKKYRSWGKRERNLFKNHGELGNLQKPQSQGGQVKSI